MTTNHYRTLTIAMIQNISNEYDLSKIKEFTCTDQRLINVSMASILSNVEVLNFNFNYIKSFKELSFCSKLRELHLHHNQIKNFRDFIHLENLPLEVLTVSANPFIKDFAWIDYRLEIIRSLPYLRVLDKIPITDEERERAFEGVEKLDDEYDPEKLREYITNKYGGSESEDGSSSIANVSESSTRIAEAIKNASRVRARSLAFNSKNSGSTVVEKPSKYIDGISEHDRSHSIVAFTSVIDSLGQLNRKQLEIIMDEIAKELNHRAKPNV